VTVESSLPFLRLEFGFTALAFPFLALLAIVSCAVVVWSLPRRDAAELMLLIAFALAMSGVLAARSVAAFFLAWEAMSLISAFLVAAQHERRVVRRATLTYLIVAQGGALCVLVALCILAGQAGSPSFSVIAASAGSLPPPLRNAVFALAFLGFGSKAGLLPLHFWLPRAHPVAPANASAMLSGVMLKVAIYGLCLTTLELAAPAPLAWGLALTLLGTVSAIAGVLYALLEHDLKRLLAYHSVENVGIVALGLGVALTARTLGDIPLASLALIAALFHTINHGLFKALLFLGSGVVGERAGTVDLERLGGLWERLVWTAPLFLVGCMSIAGLPPFNGFISEWVTFRSLLAGVAGSPLAVRAVLVAALAGLALTGGLAAACFVKVFGVAFLGRSRDLRHALTERERFGPEPAGMSILAGLCMLLGIVPLLAVTPLASVATTTLGAVPLALPMLSALPVSVAALPFAGALAVVLIATRRRVRGVPTWTCGSPVTAAAQYTATAFARPLEIIFAFLPFGLVDDVARRFAAGMLRLTRRSRALQSGSLRLYLAYAMAAFMIVVVAAR
jgi:hydrogenase-4 component B